METLRLDLYQQTACYKKPFAFKVAETYPLPPYSTVKGMLHHLMDADKFYDMKISVQGTYDTVLDSYETHYFFKKKKTEEFVISTDGLETPLEFKDITSMPIYGHMLFSVNLIIHVQASVDVINKIINGISNASEHISLGRREDLVRIDKCEVVKLKEIEDEPFLSNNAYIPLKYLSNEPYFPYRLNWKYEVVKNARIWEKIHVGYVRKGTPIAKFQNFQMDDYGDLVFFF